MKTLGSPVPPWGFDPRVPGGRRVHTPWEKRPRPRPVRVRPASPRFPFWPPRPVSKNELSKRTFCALRPVCVRCRFSLGYEHGDRVDTRR
eukprot:gene7411-biopygen3047